MPERLLGFVLHLSYEEVKIVTCDPWKRQCGGVPRNSLVLIRLSPAMVSDAESASCDRLIMVRITESIPTPVDADVQQAIFQIHKAQAAVDPITNKEFQWSALKGKIVGTYYDKDVDSGKAEIRFGLDVDTFFSPHYYEVYVPSSEHLEVLVNAFSEDPNPLEIGDLRYTETPPVVEKNAVPVKVDPSDFVGKSYGHRTALFGKTRFGKSNTMKVVADTILARNAAGQIIFDPSGEYTYWNEQDHGCLAIRYAGRCRRFSLKPRAHPKEHAQGLQEPESLLVNFYEQPDVGHSIIFSLWEGELGRVPDYIVPAQGWEPLPLAASPNQATDRSGYAHYWRTMSIWYGILKEAGFQTPPSMNVYINFPGAVKDRLMADQHLGPSLTTNGGKMSEKQPIAVVPALLKKVYQLLQENPNLFPASKTTGEPYFSTTEEGLLKILSGTVGTGARKFSRFKPYHSVQGSDVFKEIVESAQKGMTVFVDLSMGDERVRKALADRVSKSLLTSQMQLFNENKLGNRFVVLYFEEAHNLFPKSDKEVDTDVYNKLAKEGAKFHISMVYATQSISTLSPDLMKNTENFIVTHLDDDREVKELEHKRAFRDIAADVERITSKGYVRMATVSLPFALPVQIRKFEGAPISQAISVSNDSGA
ncbi:ATP-binding protein [Billgrantia pellis]|nr:DUF87 domain-containing protein [Halomonas pellis]